MSKNSTLIVKAGLLVGTLDILAAFLNFFIQTGKNPIVILRYIAAAAFGKSAMTGGAIMAFYGLLFHYLIAFAFTVLFALLYIRLWQWFKNTALIGLVYGLFVWLVMNLIVVPNTKIPAGPFSWTSAITNCLILILCMGIPLAYLFGKNRRAAK